MRSTLGALLFFFLATLLVQGQPAATQKQNEKFNAYRGVSIGLTQEQVREKLGKPESEYADEDDFELSESESARIFYDSDKSVTAIVIKYGAVTDAVPTVAKVVGENVEAKADGGIFKMVRFPADGYWVSYLKSGGEKPVVTITIREIEKSGT